MVLISTTPCTPLKPYILARPPGSRGVGRTGSWGGKRATATLLYVTGAAGYTYGKVKKGVKCYLNGVQFVKDGERFGADATNDFDALDGDDDGFMG